MEHEGTEVFFGPAKPLACSSVFIDQFQNRVHPGVFLGGATLIAETTSPTGDKERT
jgi:hypothetical protein